MKGNLTTDDNGSVVLKNLHLGTYVIREVQAPENFYNAGEEKTVTLSYAGQNVETVFSEGKLKIVKQGEVVDDFSKDFVYEMENLAGAVFEVYSAEDIYTADFQKGYAGCLRRYEGRCL